MMDLIKQQLDNEKTRTENGALAYRTSGHELLDLNFSVSSLRNRPEPYICNAFRKAYYENPDLAVRWLFFLRDARGGMGERRSFRIMMGELLKLNGNNLQKALNLIPLIPEYGRWDDVIDLSLYSKAQLSCLELIEKQFEEDVQNLKEGKPISLLAKWLPSEHPKTSEDKFFLNQFLRYAKISRQTYRKALGKMREYLRVVELQMTLGEWDKIDYSAVPSGANLLYRNAFLRHDKDRREAYLESLKRGEAKINAKVLFPCDIVGQYIGDYDESLEQLWKNLTNTKTNGDVMVVADSSASMGCRLGATRLTAKDVAYSLAIYFAERCSGPYKDHIITFSERPKYIDFHQATSLYDKLSIVRAYSEVANTNIKRTFDLILDTAVANNLDQSEIPSTVLILSDMEFDYCGEGVVFDRIQLDWDAVGYKMPKLVFWNICGRTGGIPMKENENGVVLLSGFSPTVYKMAMNNETDPYAALIRVVMDSRYDPVTEAWNK